MQKLMRIVWQIFLSLTAVSDSNRKNLFQIISRPLIHITLVTMPALAGQPRAFIKNGEVWLKKTSSEVQITSTKKNIVKLEISASGNFAAALKIAGHYEQENDIENLKSSSLENIYSILIFDLKNGKVLKDIKNPKAVIHPLGWQSDESYLYGEGSSQDIQQEFRYYPKNGKILSNKN